MSKRIFLAIFLVVCTLNTSFGQSAPKTLELLKDVNFKMEIGGKQTALYSLKNKNGMVVQLTNYGARVVALYVKDKSQHLQDVVWGYPSMKEYLNSTDIYCGPIVGRFGNRIGKGQFNLDGKNYQLTLNNHGNHLHGGIHGFESKVWDAELIKTEEGTEAVKMSYLSADGEEGYPGNLNISVTYSLTDSNELTIQYEAETDAPTVINPTSHCYFNLHGTSNKSTNSHILQINADTYTPTDSLLIPTGKIATLAGTPLDFRKPTEIGLRINKHFDALRFGKGYDHNYIVTKKPGSLSLLATVYEPSTGIVMKVISDQPAIQFYSGNFMDGKDTGKRNEKHYYRTGIALEAQNYPDAPNKSNFPSSVLRPGQQYKQTTLYRFELKK